LLINNVIGQLAGVIAMTKACIIVNCILSVFFLACSIVLLSHQFDYRQYYLEIDAQTKLEIARLKQENQEQYRIAEEAKVEFKNAKKEKDDIEELNANLERKNKDLTKKNESYETRLANVDSNIQDINKRLEDKEDRISELEKARDRQKEIAEESIRARDEAKEEQQRMEMQLSDIQGEMAEKEKLLQRSEKELLEAKMIIKSVQDAGVNIHSLFKKTKPMSGQIVAVSKDVQIVMISIGLDEGVAKGDQFTVYRGSQFVGKVIVEEPYKDMSAARIIPNMTVRDIQKGDMVTTRIGGGGSF